MLGAVEEPVRMWFNNTQYGFWTLEVEKTERLEDRCAKIEVV